MLTYRSHMIAREGWRLIAIVALLGFVLHISAGFFFAIPFWIATIVLCILFRDPKRQVPPKPLAIVSPVDGRILAIETLQDPHTQAQVLQIQISKGTFDIMTFRSPMEGKINKQWFGAVDATGSANNVYDTEENPQVSVACVIVEPVSGGESTKFQFAQWIQSDERDDVVMAIKPAVNFFKPRCYAIRGDRVGQGQRCGIIPFNAIVVVNVPVTSRLEVGIGDWVSSGSDTLATLVH